MFRRINNVECAGWTIGIIAYLIYYIWDSYIFQLVFLIITLILSVAYFGFNRKIFFDANRLFKWYSISSGIFYSIAIIGLCFRLNGFLGYDRLLQIGFIPLLFVFSPLFYFNIKRDPTYFRPQLFRSLLIGLSNLCLYLGDYL